MPDLRVRRLRFDFSEPVPVVWHPDNPAFSHAVNLMSFTAICFEKMIVEAVKEARPHFTDPRWPRKPMRSCARRRNTPAPTDSTSVH